MKIINTAYRFYSIFLVLILFCAACKKEKRPSPIPEMPGNVEEVITTLQIAFTDSISGNKKTYVFRDPDGPGGIAAHYGPTVDTQTDSVIVLLNNTTYFAEIVLLDETKSPASVISDEVEKESHDHMLFYNQDHATIVQQENPFTIKLSNDCRLIYLDLDDATPQRPLGLKTKWRTATQQSKSLLNITLKHQPGVKDGTFAPGDSDVSVNFLLQIN